MSENSYKAKDITVLKGLEFVRNNFDVLSLSDQIKQRGDKTKLAKELKISLPALSRAIDETRILSIFPNISKAKTYPLARLKTFREKILFSKKYNLQELSCRKITKLVKRWKNELEINPKILLTNEQHDLIIGSTLGDANIRQRKKISYFRVGHTKKQKKYLYWKYDLLKEFITASPYLYVKKLNNHIMETIEISTFTYQIFNFYYKLFYKNGRKRVTRKLLNMLTPRSLAIWICDDGSFDNRQGYIVLCTNSYSLEEHRIIKKYFEEIWNLSPTIGFRDKKYYYLRFKQEDSKKLIKIIEPFILESMRYKISKK